MYYFVSVVLFEIQGTGQVWNNEYMYSLVQKIRTKALQLGKDGAVMILFNTTKTSNTSIPWLGIQIHKHPDASILSKVESFFLRICSLFTLWHKHLNLCFLLNG